MSAIILLLCFIGCALSGPAFWSADFTQNAVGSTGLGAIGVNSGKLQFNWNTQNFNIIYAGNQWAEYYQYNKWFGEANSSGQILSSYGQTCSPTCGVSQLSTAMPALGLPSGVPAGRLSGRGAQTGSTGCYLYSPTTNTIVQNFTMKDDGTVCAVSLKDNRVFVLTNWAGTAPSFTIPANCSCKGKADIWIMVDHSTSISNSEMAKFKDTFVKPFLDKLSISNDEINVGMSWFNLKTGVNFGLTGDRGNINSGLNAWVTNCSSSYNVEGCQYPGTATATALVGYTPGCSNFNSKNENKIVGAIEWFLTRPSSNRGVPRIFITLTDGAMNTPMNPFSSGCTRASCGFDGCNDRNTSPAGFDLTRAVNALITASNSKRGANNAILPLTLISVGIGPSCTNDRNECISPNHLMTLAGNNSANVLNINQGFDATALSNAVQNLVLLSCPESNNLQQATCVGSCCGLCVCGSCKPPATCQNNNLCTTTTLQGPPGQECCQATTGINPCGTPANQCNKTFCNATLNGGRGLCTWGSIDCSGSSVGCEKRNCNTTTGQCTVPDRSSCPPIPCTYGPWGAWSACPVSCGGNTITRTRSINQTAADGGANCDPADSTQTIPCNTQCCPVACTFNDWTGFGQCSKTCGTGTQSRTRTTNPLVCGGAPCSGPTTDSQNCNTQCCPQDCTWNGWSGFGQCTKSCGTGTQTRTRTMNDAICGGLSCDGPTSETQNCNTGPCPVPCVGAWTEWQTFCPCNGTNLNSTVYRYFTITTPAQFNGTNCSFNDGVNQSRRCDDPQCAGGRIDCVGRNVTTNCTCANPFRTRTYFIDQIASGPGAIPCPETPGLKETIACNCTEGSVDDCKCPINCRSNFTEWGNCSCLTQTQNRTYLIYKNSSFGGINCTYAQNNTVVTQACTPICPVPCVGAWTNGTCNCTSGNKTDRFGVTTPARDGGTPCPFADGALRSNPCTAAQKGLCPTPCLGAWTAWSTCNCDYGNQTRTYRITKNATNGGAACLRPNNTIANQVCTPTGCPPANPKCVNASQCDDGNKCTLDRCLLQPSGISRCDWKQNVTCNDSSICTKDTCDPLKGCIFTVNVFCNDNSVCTNESCHPTKGCQYTKKVCPDKDICFLGACNPVTGCNTQARSCNKTSNCTESKCDVNYTKNGRTGPCYEDFICPFDFGLIAGISAGAAVAIAVAAGVVTLAVVGGGSYALASQVTTDDETIITKNPMFQSSGLQGTSPLNELN